LALTLALTLTLLAGCAIPGAGGDATAPAAAMPGLPADWQAALPAADSTAAASATGAQAARGWARFNDALLPPLIAAAQQASPTLSAAAARVAQARASRAAAAAALLPNVDAVASASQYRSLPVGGPTSSVSLGLQSAWEIDLFGGAAAGRDAAQARLQAAQAGLQAAREAVAA
jgi:outer membrane protein TolC